MTALNHPPWRLHWFRRDLRLIGNPALQKSVMESAGRVLGIFCFDHRFLARPDFSSSRFLFFLETLTSLQNDLRAAGGDLLILDKGPDEGFAEVFARLTSAGVPLPEMVTWCRDYEPFAVARDKRLGAFFRGQGILCETFNDHLLIEPHEIFRGSNPEDGYQVFSPFYRRWLEVLSEKSAAAKILRQVAGVGKLNNPAGAKPLTFQWRDLLSEDFTRGSEVLLGTYTAKLRSSVTIDLPEGGFNAALATLRRFETKIANYSDGRDIPGIDGTSQLSVYLKNGSITVAQVIGLLKIRAESAKDKSPQAKFLSELAWREFYYHILARHPRVESECFNTKFNQLKWENREDWFERWQTGQTGFPIVDAGMRQLQATGWMHNRVRMIVASFLTKDLLIDWKWGERHFMKLLLDGDLAPNNGGWQWAASTGCDPQPYFRIFNPELQSRRFDPKGDYIRRWIPELAGCIGETIHAPDAAARRAGFPAPIVEHKIQRDKALALYKACGSAS